MKRESKATTMLQDQIDSAQRQVKTDAYQMSVGELVSMYKEGDFVINPDFQRLFRWEVGQKSKLIESLLLGIPIPSIFVFEREDGKWELVDGLQRISTILEFMGLLRHPDTGKELPPSYLEGTKYLSSLEGVVWERSKRVPDIPINEQSELSKTHQLMIRRARLGVEILKKPSDNKTKYDLFQRLNAGGTPANPQELRNCVIIMVSGEFFQFVKKLAGRNSFTEVINLNEDQAERQRHMEYATRFLVHNYVPYDGKLDIEEYINEGIIELAAKGKNNKMADRFIQTFDLLHEALGADALRRYENGQHSGRVGLVAFECIAVGVGKHVSEILARNDAVAFVRKRILQFWSQGELAKFSAPGVRGTTRIQRTIKFGDDWFKP
jgi:hypothetical protein